MFLITIFAIIYYILKHTHFTISPLALKRSNKDRFSSNNLKLASVRTESLRCTVDATATPPTWNCDIASPSLVGMYIKLDRDNRH